VAQLNEQPRRVLRDLIRTQGASLCEEPVRCKAFLNDLCGSYGREVDALLKALEKRVPAELSKSSDAMPKELLVGRLTERLCSGAAIDRDSARWAVESWALALGRVSDAELASIRTVSASESTRQAAGGGAGSHAGGGARPGTGGRAHAVGGRGNPRPGGAYAPPQRTPPAPSSAVPSAGRLAAPAAGLTGRAAAPSTPRWAGRRIGLFVGAGASLLFLLCLGAIGWSVVARRDVNNAETVRPPAGMVYVPGGTFAMGSSGADGDELERPQHAAKVAPFYIDMFEVTCREYQESLAGGRSSGLSLERLCPRGTEVPMTGLDWFEARAACVRRGKRLPTEEEWEFAARGATGQRYPWGDQWGPGLANAGGVSAGIAPVSPRGPSPFGVYDMVGNVWEWTESDLVGYEGAALPSYVTRGGVAEQVVRGKVIRGGSWQDEPQDVTATIRRGYPPRGQDIDYSNTGFRCAMSAP
jgi:formylglycine-generating enzyme required for sulfatase activity